MHLGDRLAAGRRASPSRTCSGGASRPRTRRSDGERRARGRRRAAESSAVRGLHQLASRRRHDRLVDGLSNAWRRARRPMRFCTSFRNLLPSIVPCSRMRPMIFTFASSRTSAAGRKSTWSRPPVTTSNGSLPSFAASCSHCSTRAELADRDGGLVDAMIERDEELRHRVLRLERAEAARGDAAHHRVAVGERALQRGRRGAPFVRVSAFTAARRTFDVAMRRRTARARRCPLSRLEIAERLDGRLCERERHSRRARIVGDVGSRGRAARAGEASLVERVLDLRLRHPS